MIPLINMGKVINGSLSTHISKDSYGEPLGEFCQEIVIDKVYQGSVLNIFKPLVNDKIP